MEYRRLGKSGLKISEIGLGCTDLGSRIGEKESITVIKQALDAGINFIDTADVYGDGHSEEIIGKAVKGRRYSAVIATKFGLPTGDGPDDDGASRSHIMQAVEASLQRLDTDYIDLYYIHWPDTSTPIEETLRAMDNLVESGKVRYIGCCNFAAWQLCEALWISRFNNLASFSAVQCHYNLIERAIESELAPCSENYGIGIIPFFPLAGGLLTDRYQRGKPIAAGTRLWMVHNAPPPRMSNLPRPPTPGGPPKLTELNDENYAKLEKWQKFAKARNHSMEELALAWLLSHPYVSSVIAGATKPEQVTSHVAAAAWKLSAQELVELEKLTIG